jgi:hypothetical protein
MLIFDQVLNRQKDIAASSSGQKIKKSRAQGTISEFFWQILLQVYLSLRLGLNRRDFGIEEPSGLLSAKLHR